MTDYDEEELHELYEKYKLYKLYEQYKEYEKKYEEKRRNEKEFAIEKILIELAMRTV